ncbi:hypothetical protein F0562_018785 [Nyssa sinensis]|uniref:Transposase-associated domain-containing protein n=1 Tax=Nyssa sinensis TaxID=561372 RepID=A0A5J4ZCV2_9ASTE|nr:hypothetical protein F0562_018785 [Nyssa sinensis]
MNKPMDKSWIDLEYRLDESYVKGVNEFLNFAMANKLPGSEIYCPCRKCQNIKLVQEKVAYEHIIVNGFLQNYKNWIYHGEPLCTNGRDNDAATRPNSKSSMCDDMVGMIHDAFGIPNMDDIVDDEPSQTIEGRKIDEFGFTLVNFKHLLYKENRLGDEPFILASQAQQVWYVQDSLEKDWHIVVTMTPRDVFDVLAKEHMTEPQVEPYNDQHLDDNTFTNDEDFTWVTRGVDGATVDVNIVEDDDVDTESDDDVDTESDDD